MPSRGSEIIVSPVLNIDFIRIMNGSRKVAFYAQQKLPKTTLQVGHFIEKNEVREYEDDDILPTNKMWQHPRIDFASASPT